MQTLKILNKKEIKEILGIAARQWAVDYDMNEILPYVFLLNGKGRVFIANRGFEKIELSKLKISSVGLYLGELKDDELRLSVEGSQIIGPYATKNVVELDPQGIREWLTGKDVMLADGENACLYAIVRHKSDFYGSGRVKDGKLLNYLPKERRVKEVCG